VRVDLAGLDRPIKSTQTPSRESFMAWEGIGSKSNLSIGNKKGLQWDPPASGAAQVGLVS